MSQTEFSGKKALITGGTKGLGFAVAKKLAQQGAELFLAYRSDQESATQAAEALRALGARCELVRVDLSEEGAADRLFDAVAAKTRTLDIYVHNAAATAFKSLMEVKPHHVDKTMNITVKSFIRGVQRAAALMPEGGAVVAISGMDTLRAVPMHGLLGAAKSALETLTAYFAQELAPSKIRVNGVNPGFLDTESTRKLLGPFFEGVDRAMAESGPFKRKASLEEVAEVILFLCSPHSSWVVGQTVVVDGGQLFAPPLTSWNPSP